MSLIKYSINGLAFSDLDMYVSQSSGLTDVPDFKDPQKTDWPDEHGETIDLSQKKYTSRSITLDCFMDCTNEEDFLTKSTQLNNMLSTPGLLQLLVEIPDNKPLVYMVYMKSKLAYKKRWKDSHFVPTFSMELIEPEPLKMVFERKSNYVSLGIKSRIKSVYNVYWGDNDKTEVTATTDIVTNIDHNYHPTLYTIRYFVITGNIDDLYVIDLNNCEIVWNRLL